MLIQTCCVILPTQEEPAWCYLIHIFIFHKRVTEG